ncbi:MAG: YdiU family protein, partial [Reyranella sp.]|nr:YdiU family protein [Reyranella sp.]
EAVMRETVLPGAVLTRVASSHIRVGTFQFFAARGDGEALRLLADHVIARHYPDARDAAEPYRALFEGVIARQAELVARWMLVGFIHGVMNTDNCSIAGETIDYGPCAFMDAYKPDTVFSSIDHGGRYAYANQPRICHWNLARFGETLLPLLDDDSDKALAVANEALATFQGRYGEALMAGMRRKLGLFTADEADGALAQELLNAMAEGRADFTKTFRSLDPENDERARPLFPDTARYDVWAIRWRERLAREPQDAATRRAAMRSVNPVYIPRNHRVEAVLAAAIERDDYAPFEELLQVLARPYDERDEFADYAEPARPDPGYRTFCGT